jgi:RNA polymerase sigma-70 factor (ECF subfamily)
MGLGQVGLANLNLNATSSGPAATPETDEGLAARAATDPLAFAEIHVRYVDLIYRFCTYRLRETDDIEDATNQIFLQALEGLRKSRVAHLRSWLFSIAHNVVTDRYRERRDEVDIATAFDLPSRDNSPEEIAIIRSGAGELRAALHNLSPDQRKVVELRLAGLTGPEIRQVLWKSRPWVDTTQFRAVQKLRAMMAAPEQDR